MEFHIASIDILCSFEPLKRSSICLPNAYIYRPTALSQMQSAVISYIEVIKEFVHVYIHVSVIDNYLVSFIGLQGEFSGFFDNFTKDTFNND